MRAGRDTKAGTENNNISDDLQSTITTIIPDSKPENLNMQQTINENQQTASSSIKLPTVNSSSVNLNKNFK